jgi:hypothetical protein
MEIVLQVASKEDVHSAIEQEELIGIDDCSVRRKDRDGEVTFRHQERSCVYALSNLSVTMTHRILGPPLNVR